MLTQRLDVAFYIAFLRCGLLICPHVNQPRGPVGELGPIAMEWSSCSRSSIIIGVAFPIGIMYAPAGPVSVHTPNASSMVTAVIAVFRRPTHDLCRDCCAGGAFIDPPERGFVVNPAGASARWIQQPGPAQDLRYGNPPCGTATPKCRDLVAFQFSDYGGTDLPVRPLALHDEQHVSAASPRRRSPRWRAPYRGGMSPDVTARPMPERAR
jgi:hypothetical protein